MDRIVLITGANKGIGYAIANAFVSEKAKVVVVDIDEPNELFQSNNIVHYIKADVSSLRAIDEIFQYISQTYGKLDVLVNNAGIFPRKNILDINEQEWDLVMNTNLKSAFFCSQQAIKLMLSEAHGGNIINIASNAAFKGARLGAHYSASKSGLIALTKSFAKNFAHHNIAVNAIAPGYIDTDQLKQSHSNKQDIIESIPMHRIGDPGDVVKTALFLSHANSSYITGQTMFVNGGTIMYP